MKENFTTIQVSKNMARALKILKNTNEYRTVNEVLESWLQGIEIRQPQGISDDQKQEPEIKQNKDDVSEIL